MATYFQQLPWTGGLNTSLDEAMIPQNQLTVADNLVLGTRPSKQKRDGVIYGYANQGVSVVSRASSGTTRTLVINGASFYAGETIRISGSTPDYNGTYTVATVATATTRNDTLTFTGPTTLAEAATSDSSMRVSLVSNPHSVVGLHDYWFGDGVRSQRLVTVYSDGSVCSINGGRRIALNITGTAWSGTLDTSSLLTFNNKVIIAVGGTNNVMKYWDGTDADAVTDVPGTPPQATMLREHQGRIFCNDKTNPDMLHYCTTADHTQWLGVGDSGAIPVRPGDGDPVGMTAIFPPFRGDLFVAKKGKLYRITGDGPEDYEVIDLSTSIGCESHNSVVAIGTDDVTWLSDKGMHSLAAVQNYGDFSTTDVSNDIQRSFTKDFVVSRLKYAWGAYLPHINSVAMAITEQSGKNRVYTTTGVNNAVWFYNIVQKSWYRWPDMPCQSLIAARDGDQRRLYLGSHQGRVAQTFTGNLSDTAIDGTQTPVKFSAATGIIFVTGNPYDLISFKKFILYYRPKGRHNISVNIKIDDQPLDPSNSLAFSQGTSATPLGLGFKLGSTPLGSVGSFLPADRTISGLGHGCKIYIDATDLSSEVEIQGFSIEYELATPA